MKLRVGILTMHRVHNCGSFLQAYALQEALESIGCNCEIIDYLYPNKLHVKDIKNSYPITFRNGARHLLHNLYHCRWHVVKMQMYEIIWDVLLHIRLRLSKKSYHLSDELNTNPPVYDVYVLGSDQVWNERFIKNDSTFFLSFAKEHQKCISYASSLPNLSISENFIENATTNLPRYAAISTREKESASILSALLKRNVESHIDPVFLHTKNEWRKKFHINPKHEKYVLFYMLNYMGDIKYDAYVELHKLVIQNKEKGYKIYSNVAIPSVSVELLNDFFPRGFIQIIANADYVITDSFHTTAFSLIFNIPVKSIIADVKKDIRIIDLCERLGQFDSDGFVQCNEQKLRDEREKAYAYLRNNIC